MLGNKRGSLQDLIFIGVILLFTSMVVLIGFKLTTEIDSQIQGMNVLDVQGKAASTKLVAVYPGSIDNTFLILAIGLSLITLVLAALVRIHPMFIFFYFIGLTIVIYVSGIFSNIYQEMAGDAEFSALANQLTFIDHIMEFLPFIVGVFGTILMVTMYKLWRNGEN